jgi:hypothetical protein
MSFYRVALFCKLLEIVLFSLLTARLTVEATASLAATLLELFDTSWFYLPISDFLLLLLL